MTTDATVPPSRAELQEHVLEQCEREQVRFINLQFTDIVGIVKSVDYPVPPAARCVRSRYLVRRQFH